MTPHATTPNTDREIATRQAAAEYEGWPSIRHVRRTPVERTIAQDEQECIVDTDTLETLGITRVSMEYFHYRNYRYTNLDDAAAEAKRDRANTRQ